MSLNPTVYLLLAVNGLIFIGAALLVYWLARRLRRVDIVGGDVERERSRTATLATVSVGGGENPMDAPAPESRRFRFSPARAPRSAAAVSDGAVLNLHIQVDALLVERLAEFLARRVEPEGSGETETEGCVIVVADAIPPAAFSERTGAAYLSGASAALSLGRALAEAQERAFRTLLIDTGSPAWSIYGVDPPEDSGEDAGEGENGSGSGGGEELRSHSAPDIIPLPEEISGVYDVVAGREALDDCLLAEDDSPLLTALAPGEMPLRWTEMLRSTGMRRLLGSARAMAEVVLVYAPRVAEYPEQVLQLSEWADGVIVIGAEMGRGASREERDHHRLVAEFEQAATRLLEPAPQESGAAMSAPALAPLLGRIALDFASVARD